MNFTFLFPSKRERECFSRPRAVSPSETSSEIRAAFYMLKKVSEDALIFVLLRLPPSLSHTPRTMSTIENVYEMTWNFFTAA